MNSPRSPQQIENTEPSSTLGCHENGVSLPGQCPQHISSPTSVPYANGCSPDSTTDPHMGYRNGMEISSPEHRQDSLDVNLDSHRTDTIDAEMSSGDSADETRRESPAPFFDVVNRDIPHISSLGPSSNQQNGSGIESMDVSPTHRFRSPSGDSGGSVRIVLRNQESIDPRLSQTIPKRLPEHRTLPPFMETFGSKKPPVNKKKRDTYPRTYANGGDTHVSLDELERLFVNNEGFSTDSISVPDDYEVSVFSRGENYFYFFRATIGI